MVFIGREREIGWMRLYLEHEANKILAVTGKANCGKTALMQEVMKRLGATHTFFYLDLRLLDVSAPEDFVKVLLYLLRLARREQNFIRRLFNGSRFEFSVMGFKVSRDVKFEDVLQELYLALIEELKKVKNPVIVVDELQSLRELYYNGGKKLIDSVLEFFISLTKHQHLAHVIVLTSDSTFYAELYSKSGMEKRMRFYLLDELQREEAMELIRYWSREYDVELDPEGVYNYTGGNPALIEDIVAKVALYGEFEDVVKDELRMASAKIKRLIKKGFSFKRIEEMEYEEGQEWVEENVLFYNVQKECFEPQHRIIELAWGEVLKVRK